MLILSLFAQIALIFRHQKHCSEIFNLTFLVVVVDDAGAAYTSSMASDTSHMSYLTSSLASTISIGVVFTLLIVAATGVGI